MFVFVAVRCLLVHVVLWSATVAFEHHDRTWHPPKDTRSPQDVMVDVVNDLGLNLLKIHNTNNENNIALSPYGVASILTALLEGVQGRAAIEIQKCGGFPADRDVIRVGLRDIHRLLRSYFIPQEGFLSGLSLSSEKVTLKPDYQSILRFYGFDMTSFNTPIYPNIETTTPMTNITTMSDEDTTETTTMQTTTEEMTTMSTTLPPTTLPPTTLPSTMPTTTQETTMRTDTTIPETTTVPATTVPATTILTTTDPASTVPATTVPATTVPATTVLTTTVPTTTTTNGITTMMTTTEQNGRTTPAVTTTIGTTNIPTTIVTTLLPDTTTQTITTLGRTTRSVETTMTTVRTTVTTAGLTDTTTTFPQTTTFPSTTFPTTFPTTVPTTTFPTTVPTTTFPTTLPTTTEAGTTTQGVESTTFRIRRIGRSVVDYLIARYYDDHIPDLYNEPVNNKHTFLVNGIYEETHVHFMTYDAVLPFYYVHNLNALALRFPLDSPKYYLLLVLPVDEEGIDKLICDIGNAVTLKQIASHMRPTYVRAVIPSFMLRGFVILTSSLQKIGIRQIFEPRHTDFSPMTDDKDIYVTNIEQAITVMIKNYMDPTMINKNRNLYQYGPVEFKATHPFLYFVMDSELDVTLVAGKIINPINSRIQ